MLIIIYNKISFKKGKFFLIKKIDLKNKMKLFDSKNNKFKFSEDLKQF